MCRCHYFRRFTFMFMICTSHKTFSLYICVCVFVCVCVRACAIPISSQKLLQSASKTADKRAKQNEAPASVGGVDGCQTSNQCQRDSNNVDPRARLDIRGGSFFFFCQLTTKLTNIRYMVFWVSMLCQQAPHPCPHPPLRFPFNCYFRVFRRLLRPQLASLGRPVARWLRRRFWTIFNLSANQIENCQNC